jgi:hypothetical protein
MLGDTDRCIGEVFLSSHLTRFIFVNLRLTTSCNGTVVKKTQLENIPVVLLGNNKNFNMKGIPSI